MISADKGTLADAANPSTALASQAGPNHPTEMPPAPRLKLLSLAFVAVFAALLASSPIRNSDLWLHLARGRELAQTFNLFDSTPASASQSAGNLTWLFDLLSYAIYEQFGGGGLVFAKVLVVVGLALLLMRLSRTAAGWRIATACTTLALLAMGLRLLPQPAILSYFFLALTLWWLRDRESDDTKPVAGPHATVPLLPPWPLVALFVVWANVDSGFVLGLGTVALIWLGRVLDANDVAHDPSRLPALGRCGLALLLLAIACLLNPAHVYALLVPLGLAQGGLPGASMIPHALSQSPFHEAYWGRVGLLPAGMAYFPLLILGLLSFLGNQRRWQWFLPWVGLALLSAFQVRAIPYFAVVAGPVLAWNLQAMLTRRAAAAQRMPRRRRAASLTPLLVPLGVGLLVCAWPGWLQAPPYEPRRWDVALPTSLERGAAATRRWRQERKLGQDKRGLHLSFQTAAAFAWFCPEDKGLLDPRVSASLLGEPQATTNWRERMRSAGVDHVIVYDPDRARLFTALARLLQEPKEWPLLYLEGDLAVFGWRDPGNRRGKADVFRQWQLDLDRLAFHPAEDKKAPAKQSDREPRPRYWWEAFWKPAPPRPIDRDEASLLVLHAEALQLLARYRYLEAWDPAQAAGLIAAISSWDVPGGLVDAHVRSTLLPPSSPGTALQPEAARPILSPLANLCMGSYAWSQDDVPPAVLFLAVRAARRAVADSPEDAKAYLALGESYYRLLRHTRERVWAQREPRLVDLRNAQASEALNRAIALKPNLAQAHLLLGKLYHELNYLDLALKHFRTFQQLEGQGLSENFLAALERRVDESERAYAADKGKLRVFDRAMGAFQRGLAGKARDMLLESDLAAFGKDGMKLELELLLRTGRAKNVWKWTQPEQMADLGARYYYWLRVQALAASGDYALAEAECAELASNARGQMPEQGPTAIALMIGQVVLDQQPAAVPTPRPSWRSEELMRRFAGMIRSLRPEADANVMRGLLALEEGEVDEAAAAFALALAIWRDEATAASGGGLDFGTRPIAQAYARWLE